MADESTFQTRAFATAADFDAWLAAEHDRAPGLFLKVAKKSAGIPSLTAAEAVEVALCHGWIDGRANRVDDDWFTVRYTPRRPKSVWSQKNVQSVARLTAEGRMRPAGLAAVEAAQADGRWDRAYAGPATITVPEDLTAALAAVPGAAEAFAGLDGANRYAVLWRVHTAATPQTRAKRIAACVQLLADGRRIHD
ncbi:MULTISPECIES: YdeI/OmpD-associated family protein [unclassified Modestobacter]|uniref:YdeI/OmpD-associated family protein n=1 Tax=unclassified Modestobacter TaxID=2643866 RepID=UPI0022AA889B|nr:MULTISPECIES: YdeI/OmpD-associated family protein [unclassified Modestobacter]MCZ2823247.1 YdeI/OmpD-associated family protein [Modestobacter sp. VKM Ac-2981]MCZ2851492.1 YdeI/OmpD-associated family protein [Modestobacter sp. VKM Ac-2982]